VDDETEVVEVMEEVLTLLGYRVTAYYNSPAAWDDFRHRPTEFDIVVTDQTMPGLTGLQLAARIREINPDIPVILCTGYTPGISKEDLRQAGRCHLAAKPLEPTRLSEIIQSVLHRSSSGGTEQWETSMLGAVE
jgi:CheY-like chemotaxis protein